MKILLITEFFSTSKVEFTGGVEARTHFIHKYLSKKNDLKVISRSFTYITASPLSIFPRLWFQITAFFKALSIQADIIEGSNFICYLPAFFAAKLKGIPAVAWYPDVYLDSWVKNVGILPGIFGSLLEKISLSLPWDQIIAMSNSTKQKLISAGVDPQRITIVYGGVEAQKIKSLKVKKRKTLTICTAVRLVSYKRINDLIIAVAKINKQNFKLNLIIIGEGSEKQNLIKLAQKLDIGKKVNITGNLPHAKTMKIIKSCHLFSLPSIVEGFGLVTIEAMAAGVPFVSSNISPTKEITQNGKGGLLFTPKNPIDLAKKTTLLLKNKKLYLKKRKEGLILATRYKWQKIAKETEAVYQKALHRA